MGAALIIDMLYCRLRLGPTLFGSNKRRELLTGELLTEVYCIIRSNLHLFAIPNNQRLIY